MAATNAVSTTILLPEIISSSVSEHSLGLTLHVAENLACFKGHFPEFQILPGVVQLSWAVHYAREFLGLTAPVMNVERLKFTCPIQPGIQVMLRINVEKNNTSFYFYSPRQSTSQERLNFSQGRLIYAQVNNE